MSVTIVATNQWPLGTYNVANVSRGLHFRFYFSQLDIESCMWLVASVLDGRIRLEISMEAGDLNEAEGLHWVQKGTSSVPFG